MKFFCECNDVDCDKKIELTLDVAENLMLALGQIIIVEGCPRGPEPDDVLAEKRDGYSIYSTGGE